MAKQTIFLGTTSNDGTGTKLRAGGDMINDNFNELYGWTGWQSRVDTTNTQSLTGATNNLISFAGTLEQNGGLTLMNGNSKITPIALGDAIHVDFSFTVVTPGGADHYVNVLFIVNGIVYRSQTTILAKGSGVDDGISVSFFFPIGTDFLTNGGEFYINPDVAVTIKNRYISVSRIHKAL